ncbi:hypothetical protein SFUMM280S_10365 [Streptomyces fumanus]
MPLLPRSCPVTSGGSAGTRNSTCSAKSWYASLVRRSPQHTSIDRSAASGQAVARPSVCCHCAWEAAVPSKRATGEPCGRTVIRSRLTCPVSPGSYR